jgi:putative transposase
MRGRAGRRPAAPDTTPETAPDISPHKGWYSRGYLPHFDGGNVIQAITYRLADALPIEAISAMQEQLAQQQLKDDALRGKIEAYLDAGRGACYLRHPEVAALVENGFFHFDGTHYRLLAWVVMPNHVHVLIETMAGLPLPEVIRRWKTFTAREANRLLRRSGPFWQPDYWDRYIRDQSHLENVMAYIHNNPVKAGLVQESTAYRWSSANQQLP